ncbi:MAG TPA: 50S ribosomal protein L1 [bacterium]|nr:50S ribosomal protein L1 [bacterium]
MKKSKRYKGLSDNLEKDKVYDIEEAVDKIKGFHSSKFDETVELSINLGLDVKKLQQPVRNSVVLPHGAGKTVKILVFASGENAIKAKNLGADYVGEQDLTEKIKGGFLDFDAVIATPDMMKLVSPLGKILGPRGLMPNPKTGTVTNNLENIISEIKKGRIDFKMDKDGNLHIPVGKVSFDREKLVENIKAALDSVVAAKPPSAKSNYIRSSSLSLTMSPSIRFGTGKILQEAV